MKKILITYATAGTGHTKAAMAIKKAFDEIAPEGVEISLIDSLDYTSGFFKWAYLKIYLLLVNRLPLLWGLLYYITDNYYINLSITPFRVFSNRLNSRRFRDYLISLEPDVIISTHFFPSEAATHLKKKGLLKSCLITVVTDYGLHPWWILDSTDIYIVSSQEEADDLFKKNIGQLSDIRIIGIPVEPEFTRKLDREDILLKNNLKDGMFTVLVIGGGFGVGPIEDIVKTINGVSNHGIQVITICGYNRSLVKRLVSIKGRLKVNLKVLGYVDNVYDYMEVSDILISKSGGITISESLAKELPMIIIFPIPGQETRNADFLTNRGAAIKIEDLSDLKPALEDLTSNREKLRGMKDATKRIRKPQACYEIARLAIGCIGKDVERRG